MSAYRVIEIKIKNIQSIVEGLKALGIPEGEIQVYQSQVFLTDYRGRKTKNKADVVVERRTIKRLFSNPYSSDIGFEMTKDGMRVHLSDYDHWWEKKKGKFFQTAAKNDLTLLAMQNGYSVQMKQNDGEKMVLSLVRNY